ncbi:MAG TPA: MltA domain-containing protein [Stellaceae bacterium]|nr:MltA domain-containing protein [Stellaceae bacterium]
MLLLVEGLVRDIGPSRLTLAPVTFDRLSGWRHDGVAAALLPFLKSCSRFLARPETAPFDSLPSRVDYGQVGDWRAPCRAALSLPQGDDAAARRFFEGNFVPFAVADRGEPQGLFTGYFEVELKGSRRRHGPYQTPLYRRPPRDLATRYSRAEIEDGALKGRGLALVWVDDPIAAFFLQIQGSGVIKLDDGTAIRVGYAGQNGRPYVPIGRVLLERGVIPRAELTMQRLRDWLKAHPKEGDALRRQDPSYVYFREIKGDGPIGAEGIALTAERSLAVDRHFIPLGVPIWLDAQQRFGTKARLRRLFVAQDTGGAIRGPVRGDLFWGTGAAAGVSAGATNAYGRYFVLLPRAVADRLAATS